MVALLLHDTINIELYSVVQCHVRAVLSTVVLRRIVLYCTAELCVLHFRVPCCLLRPGGAAVSSTSQLTEVRWFEPR